MHISEFRLGKKAEAMRTIIERRYDLTIDTTDIEHLNEVRNHYRAKRTALLTHLGEVAALKSPDYTKAVLIAEAAHMILREIAPKRRKRVSSQKS